MWETSTLLLAYMAGMAAFVVVCAYADVSYSVGLGVAYSLVAMPYMLVVIVRDHRVLLPARRRVKRS